ncbi:MAG TPA: hypothetical protein PKI19_02545, partial [Elusimicrobiales bacterium]|nr:hypothetical protein [Elusimicrobiales bacterium]
TVKGMLSLASTDDDYALDIRQTGGTTPAGIITQKIGGTFASPQAVGDGSKIFALMAAGYNGTEGRVTAGMEGYVDGQVTEGNVPGRLEFLTSPGAGGTVSRMVIKGDGSVGISTGLPQAALDVVATTAVSSAAVQIWRNYSGMAVASVTASGYLLAGGAQIGDMSPIMVDTHSVVSISTRIVNVNGIDEGGGSALAIRAGTRGTTGADMLAGVSIEAGVYNGDDLSKLMPLRLNIRKEGETGGAHVDTAMALFIDEINVSESDSTQIDNTYGIFIDKQKSPDLIQPNVYALYSKDPEARTYFAGDVGIGTAAPSALLEVRDAEATAGYVLLVGTGSSTSLVVTSSGTVGVGTANPSTMTYLNVQARSHNGTAGEDYTSALMSTIYAEGTDSKDGVSGGHFNASVNSDTPLKYLIGVYAALERRNGSGAADLDNAAGIYIDQMKDVGTGAGRINKTVGLYIATQTTTGQLNAPYAIYSEDPEARTFFAGEVGIGTETPRAALDVRGAAEAPEIQIWRGGGGNIVSSMSATGVMAATKFVGDGSGLTSLPSGLAIGDTYGGGVVFWVDAKGKQALIAATGDQSTSIQWAPNSTTVTGAKLNGVYAGKTNTIIISTVHPTGNFAARACADYRLVVNAEYYDDWYLPSIYEMGQLYSQSSNIGGGFTAAYYWSSTELDTAMAYAADFANTGTPTGVVKTNVGRIRCVRAAPSAAIADLPRNAETVTDGAYLSSTQTFTGVNTFKEVTINGGLGIGVVGPQGLLQIGADGLFITSGGAIQTVGKGNGTVYGNSRGNGAVDLQTYRTSGLHVAAGAYSVIAGGQGNAAGSDNAAVGGGKSNIAEGDSSFVGGGSSNTASGTYSFVGGGGPTGAGKPGNKAVSDYSAVVGGSSNTADSNSYMSFIGAGSENRTGAQQVVVAGGWMNRAGAGSNYYSAVVGGWSNTSIGDSSFVGAGGGNLANGAYSAVPGGEYNVASGQKAAVPGGSYNTAKGGYSFAAGRKSSSTADGTFTWADSAGFVVENNVADRTWFKNRGGFLVTASTNTADPGSFVDGAGRVGIATMTPQGMFQVGGGSLTVLANGKVGIGLFSPAATLEVLETNTAENAFIVKAGTSSDNSYLTVSTSGVVAVRGSLVGAKTWQRIRKIELTSFGNDLTFSGLDTTEKEYKLVVRMVYDGSSCSNPGYNELALSANNISGTGYNYITHISSSDNAGASQWVTHTINSGNMILGRYSNVTGHVTMAEGTLLVSSSMAMAQVYQGKCHTYTQTSGYMHRAHEVYATMIPGSDSGPGEIKVKTSPASTNCFGAGSYAELWAFR